MTATPTLALLSRDPRLLSRQLLLKQPPVQKHGGESLAPSVTLQRQHCPKMCWRNADAESLTIAGAGEEHSGRFISKDR